MDVLFGAIQLYSLPV